MTLLVTMTVTKKAPIIMEGNSIKAAAENPAKIASASANTRGAFLNCELRIVSVMEALP